MTGGDTTDGHRHGPGSDDGHDRGHRHGHAYRVDPAADRRYLLAALALIVVFMAGEVVVGVLAGSLALLSDAAHMLTDAASIGLALVAMRLAARPPRGGYTYGLRRAEILSAQANGLSLLLLAGWLGYEAVRRLLAPPEVAGGPVLATALVGVAVNLAAVWLLGRANRTSLNIEGAFQHILNDLYAFLSTAVAGLIVLLTGFARADTLASLVVVALMVRAGIGLVRESGRILLEAAPPGVVPEEVGRTMAGRPRVTEVHDLHVWQITSGEAALSAHVLADPGADCHAVRVDLERLLGDAYGLTHTTLQVDHAPPELLHLGPADDGHCAGPHGVSHRVSRRDG